ncbi:MAG: ankyrin repeat domain-containing protein [Candidatus Riflebacteria bacterium]|nr:ankyrin repeat domain-containing protein [Candidatus Riflebacteria bacterium]
MQILLSVIFVFLTVFNCSVATAENVKIKPVEDSTGHYSVGINDDSLKEHDIISFSLLNRWNYNRENNSDGAPEEIKKLNGSIFSIAGFMFPLQEGEKIKAFLLMATTQTCCYGPRPQFTQFMLVESEKPVEFSRIRPVIVSGKFFLEPKPDDGYIFRMECHDIQQTEITENNFSENMYNASDVRDFDFSLLEGLKKSVQNTELERIALPGSISAFVGQLVSMKGNIVFKKDSDSEHAFVLARYPWDGCCQGTPPDIFTSVEVFLASDVRLPQIWQKSGVFVGNLSENNVETRKKTGFFTLKNAMVASLSNEYDGEIVLFQNTLPIHNAVSNNDKGGIRLFFRSGYNIDSRDSSGFSPFHFAAQYKNEEMLSLLYDLKADIHALNKNHQTALHLAAGNGNDGNVSWLIAKKCMIDAIDNNGFTPLTWALALGHSRSAELLLNAGARHDIPTKPGDFPCHLAIKSRLPAILDILKKKGADFSIRTASGETCMQLAERFRMKDHLIRVISE